MASFLSKNAAILCAILLGMSFCAPTLHAATSVRLSVPYVSQVPDGNWVLPWSQACEEASVVMIDRFYTSKKQTTKAEDKEDMQKMIAWEDQTFKKNDDTDADQTQQLIKARASFDAVVKRDPTVEEIVSELRAEHPVIAMVNMYELYQDTRSKPVDPYHVVVIIGYDEAKDEFIIHDPAKKASTAYATAVLMGSLHDYSATTKLADNKPTVIFTNKREIPNLFEHFFFRIGVFILRVFLR